MIVETTQEDKTPNENVDEPLATDKVDGTGEAGSSQVAEKPEDASTFLFYSCYQSLASQQLKNMKMTGKHLFLFLLCEEIVALLAYC